MKQPQTTPKHIHKAKYDENGKLMDACAECGEDFRNADVHFTNCMDVGRNGDVR